MELLNLPKQVGAALVAREDPGLAGLYLGSRLKLPVQKCWLKATRTTRTPQGKLSLLDA